MAPQWKRNLPPRKRKACETGLFVIHPLTGEKLPVWMANYVLMGYGEGAVMAVPAHDERDFEFATKYSLPIKPVIKPVDSDLSVPLTQAYVEHGLRLIQANFPALRFRRQWTRSRRRWKRRDWVKNECTTVCATGAFRASATGVVLFLLFIVTNAGSCRCRTTSFPVVLPENLVPDGSGNPLAKTPSFYEVLLSPLRQACAAGNGYHGYFRGFLVVLHPLRLCRPEQDA